MTRCTLFGNVEVNELAFHQHDGDSHKYVHLEIKALILIAPDTIPELCTSPLNAFATSFSDGMLMASSGAYFLL